jgi:predicted O-linked N-acetylglucosamine transferase (SPINDLY family)
LEALADYDQAVALDPQHANAFCNRGTVLESLGRHREALASYDRALALNPKDAFAYYNRGNVLRVLRRFGEAVASYDQAIALNSGYVEAYFNRGHLLYELSRNEEAAASLGKGLELCGYSMHSPVWQPVGLLSQLTYVPGLRRSLLMHMCDWHGLDAELQWIAEGLRKQLPVAGPFLLLGALDDRVLQRAAAEIWIRHEAPPDHSLGPIAKRPRSQKIRVGYFSSDFRAHPVAYLTAGLFERHDRSKFDLTAFAFGPETKDAMRARLSRTFERFLDVEQRTDAEVATLARELGIDIAVDLNGITKHCRCGIFAMRAAPLQVSYLGYAGTSGAPYMDYLIADSTVVPRMHQREYLEKIIYLPGSYMPFDSSYEIASRVFTREELRLPPTAFVFCCFNSTYKITPETFDAWTRIMARRENSVLWLSHSRPAAMSNLRKEATRRGIDERRLIFADRLESLPEHLARVRAADLFLDTFPYNAHSTAVDALWAGLPIVTYTGESFVSRVSASLLSAVGLPELVTRSRSEYEELAVSLAADPEHLRRIRDTLAQNRLTAALFDTAQYVKGLEAAYETIYSRHLSGAETSHVNDPVPAGPA